MIPIDPQLQLVLVILHCRYAGAFTMDAIALIAFGLKINSQNDKNNQFVRMAKRGFQSFISNPLVYIQGRLTKFFRSLSSITTVFPLIMTKTANLLGWQRETFIRSFLTHTFAFKIDKLNFLGYWLQYVTLNLTTSKSFIAQWRFEGRVPTTEFCMKIFDENTSRFIHPVLSTPQLNMAFSHYF